MEKGPWQNTLVFCDRWRRIQGGRRSFGCQGFHLVEIHSGSTIQVSTDGIQVDGNKENTFVSPPRIDTDL